MALVMAVVVGGGDTLEQRRLWVGPWGPLNLATTATIIAIVIIIIIIITFFAATTITSIMTIIMEVGRLCCCFIRKYFYLRQEVSFLFEN